MEIINLKLLIVMFLTVMKAVFFTAAFRMFVFVAACSSLEGHEQREDIINGGAKRDQRVQAGAVVARDPFGSHQLELRFLHDAGNDGFAQMGDRLFRKEKRIGGIRRIDFYDLPRIRFVNEQIFSFFISFADYGAVPASVRNDTDEHIREFSFIFIP